MKNTCNINVSVGEDTAKNLAVFSIESGLKKSEIVDRAIKLYLHEVAGIENVRVA